MSDLQPELFPLAEFTVEGNETKHELFEAFHNANPHVFEALYKIARDLQRQGHKRSSMKLLFERLRWLYALQTKGDTYKLNNNYTSYYARLLMAYDHANLGGFFSVREQRGEDEVFVVNFRRLKLVQRCPDCGGVGCVFCSQAGRVHHYEGYFVAPMTKEEAP